MLLESFVLGLLVRDQKDKVIRVPEMATVSSPRPSLTSYPPSTSADSSRRTSVDTSTRSQSRQSSTSQDPIPASQLQPQQRRNRAALRDYYGIKNAAPPEATSGLQHEDLDNKESELDRKGFDAEAYVKDLLAREGLEGLIKVEAGLINEIKGLDGERKALVYDNYSKLIAATETIRKMRTNMDPLTSMTGGLRPTIEGIAKMAAGLARPPPNAAGNDDGSLGKANRDRQDTVRWILGTPVRLRARLETGEKQAAEEDWAEIRRILDKWEGTKGVDEIRQQCLEILEVDNALGIKI